MSCKGIPWEWLWYFWEHVGAPGRTFGAPGSTWECRRQVGEHLESQWSSLEKTTLSLGILLVCLEIIATTYCSTIVKTHEFNLYSYRYIYVSNCLFLSRATHLDMLYLDGLQVVLESDLWCTWKWRLSELRDTLQSHDQASLEMCLEVVKKLIWRFTWRPWSTDHRDALQDHDWPRLEVHCEDMPGRSWRL